MSVDSIKIVRDFVAAWNRRDRAAIAAMLHPDVICHGIPLPVAEGREAAMTLLDGFLAADEVDWRIVHIAECGAVVLTERIDRFRFSGRDWTSVRAAGVFEMSDDGYIKSWRDYFDLSELEAAMPS